MNVENKKIWDGIFQQQPPVQILEDNSIVDMYQLVKIE